MEITPLKVDIDQYNLSGIDLIRFYEKDIPRRYEELRHAESLEARIRLEKTIKQMEKTLREEKDKLRERGVTRRKWMWWR